VGLESTVKKYQTMKKSTKRGKEKQME